MINNFEYFKPSQVKDVASLLKAYADNIKVLAGGTDLLVAMQEGDLAPDYIVDIKGLTDIDRIKYDKENQILRLGAATSLNDIAASKVVQKHWPLLAEAAQTVGSYQLRNRATIGGNLCNSSPAADTLAPLVALEAEVEMVGLEGSRIMKVKDFLVGPGQNRLSTGEIVTELRLPKPSGAVKGRYIKHSRRKAVDLATVGVAVIAEEGDLGYRFKVALGAVAPTPIRAYQAEKILNESELNEDIIDKAVQAAGEAIFPITDLRASKDYRLKMVKVQLRRAIEKVIDSWE
ncbi:FAD binding domain-containing protein [Fuchsiella alkaliacetigena]|uniref:FAD binding domain-containing protein n=1 Tax=Fuchsiella alkaliacetigena TaxID=957042 RepID=UPI00200AACD4|nr:xanthine dehydrogenase family protein subunit M [Fuchsiella alkaliacetigena]MCK8825714.1 xanthine dehydrogenase family protein subunit M [Fuchsiella alkaliacetigena]